VSRSSAPTSIAATVPGPEHTHAGGSVGDYVRRSEVTATVS
jgi:hypothetical protein